MSAAHTPAPWAIKFRNDSSAYISMGSPDGEHKQFDIEFDARYPSDVADARLIAAAPDLLEALVSVAEELSPDNCEAWLLEEVRAAIAKATGGQS